MINPTDDVPRAFDRKAWAEIPEHYREEATRRAAFLVVRAETPSVALYQALKSMDEEVERFLVQVGDENEGLPFDWSTFHDFCKLMPLPWRRPGGTYTKRIFDLVCEIEASARNMAELRGYRDASFDPASTYGDIGIEIDEIIVRRKKGILKDLGLDAPVAVGHSSGLGDDRVQHESSDWI